MTATRMAGFGYKTGWLAIRDGGAREVVDALGGRIVGNGAWREGVERAYAEADIVIATPPLTGAGGATWSLVAGRWVAMASDYIDVAALSGALDREVQLFYTDRVTESHEWTRAVGGRLVRSFGYLGESGTVTRWQGDPQEIEFAIGLPATFDAAHDSVTVREDDVMRVAAAWSLDPAALEGKPATEPLGVARLPVDPDRQAQPRAEPTVVDITDLIASGLSFEDFNDAMTRRLRKR
ncbi:hypothetical protein [Phytohabitans kaempferiae]|uniref:NAD(P)-binding domain-containing protein n=1 Tax=Phytohabitans kaempferiae TaxID=1620943 RepID=A0ABV6LXE6_9ACTN